MDLATLGPAPFRPAWIAFAVAVSMSTHGEAAKAPVEASNDIETTKTHNIRIMADIFLSNRPSDYRDIQTIPGQVAG